MGTILFLSIGVFADLVGHDKAKRASALAKFVTMVTIDTRYAEKYIYTKELCNALVTCYS